MPVTYLQPAEHPNRVEMRDLVMKRRLSRQACEFDLEPWPDCNWSTCWIFVDLAKGKNRRGSPEKSGESSGAQTPRAYHSRVVLSRTRRAKPGAA
jgi:hypothetical protein